MENVSEVIVRQDPAAICRALAEQMVRDAHAAIQKRGQYSLFLAGGSTPEPLYKLLASAFEEVLDWTQVHLFWGDERHVPLDHPDSNYRMAKETLFSKLPIPDENLHPVDPDADTVEDAAASYADTIRKQIDTTGKSGDVPVCDEMLLGLGSDGHTASLFPHSPILKEQEEIVRGVDDPPEQHDHPRVTVTYPFINHARNTRFLVTGERKRNTVDTILNGDPSVDEYPASGIEPEGTLTWWLDKAAHPE